MLLFLMRYFLFIINFISDLLHTSTFLLFIGARNHTKYKTKGVTNYLINLAFKTRWMRDNYRFT